MLLDGGDEILRQPPARAHPRTHLRVVRTEHLALRATCGALAAPLDDLLQVLAARHGEDRFAEVVQQPDEVGLGRLLGNDEAGQRLSGTCGLAPVRQERVAAQPVRGEGRLHEPVGGRGHQPAAQRVRPQDEDGLLQAAHASAEPGARRGADHLGRKLRALADASRDGRGGPGAFEQRQCAPHDGAGRGQQLGGLHYGRAPALVEVVRGCGSHRDLGGGPGHR